MNQFYPKKSQLTGARWLARHIYLSCILVLAGINVAHAVPNTWYLDGLQFNTNTTAVGSFVYDADTNTYNNINIFVTKAGNTNTYGVPNPNSTGNSTVLVAVTQAPSDLTGIPNLLLVFDTPLTNSGGTIDITLGPVSYQGTCSSATCNPINAPYDDITAGRVTTTAPLPQTWYLEGLQFNTDATATGSFVYDAIGNTFSNIQINVTNSSGTNTYGVPNPTSLGNSTVLVAVTQAPPDLTGIPNLLLVFDTPLTNSGGTIDITLGPASYQGTCSSATCNPINAPYDDITAGRVTTSLSAPTITSSATTSVSENQTSAIDVQATDNFDTEGAGLTFSISGGADQALFNIDASSGAVTFVTAPDFETPADSGGDNNYAIQVTVTDSDGLAAAQDIVITVTDVAEDTTPPTANPTIDPVPNAAGWNNSNVTINWNWSDESGGSGLDLNNCTTNSLLDTDGRFDNLVTCTDLAGNIAESTPVTVNLDKTAPDTTITANPPAISTSSDASFEFTGSDALSGVSGFVCKIDNGVLAGTGPCISPHNLTGLANGDYIFTVYASDVAGNDDPTPASYSFTVAVPLSCAPGTYLANPGDTTCTLASPGFFVAIADATEQTACAVGTFSAISGAISCTLAPPGSFVDVVGSSSSTFCTLGSFSANAGSASCTLAEIAFYVDSEGAVAQIACPVNTTTTSTGSTDISDCISVNSAPVLDAIGNQTVDEGQLLEFTVSASDPNAGDTLTFQLGNPPTGATLINNGNGTATFSWTPDFTQAGNYVDVLFTVTDDGVPVESDMETITITVGDVNRPPQFDALASQNSDEGVELSFNVQANDPDGNAITLLASNLPNGAGFIDNGSGSGTFIWTPAFEQAGNYTVIVTATDDGAPVQSDTLDVTITIGNVNQVPVLSMIGDRTVVEDELLEIILTGSDPDGDNLSYSIGNIPIGASFIDNGDGTATFSWIPDFGQAGSFPNVLFTLTDNGVPVETDSETISILVNPGELEPFASCGGFDVFETEEDDFIAPGFDGEVIVGSDGHDLLTGTNGPDLILGLNGADDIFGKKGDDVICGGRGADFIKGQRGNDTLYGQRGHDELLGGRGNDTLYGQRGQDELLGGRGSDNLFGGNGDDELYGNQGADTLNGGNGNDFCRGGQGRDTLTNC